MHKNVTRSERAIMVAVLTLAGGCQLAQMQVSPPLDAVPALPVEPLVRKWSAPIRFGAWHTTSIDEGDTQWRPGRSRAARPNAVAPAQLSTSAGPAGNGAVALTALRRAAAAAQRKELWDG